MKFNFLELFLGGVEDIPVKPEILAELASRDSTHLAEHPVSVFDGVNRHIGDLIEAEARARAAHAQAIEALEKFEADMKAQYEAQLAAIKVLFPEKPNDELL